MLARLTGEARYHEHLVRLMQQWVDWRLRRRDHWEAPPGNPGFATFLQQIALAATALRKDNQLPSPLCSELQQAISLECEQLRCLLDQRLGDGAIDAPPPERLTHEQMYNTTFCYMATLFCLSDHFLVNKPEAWRLDHWEQWARAMAVQQYLPCGYQWECTASYHQMAMREHTHRHLSDLPGLQPGAQHRVQPVLPRSRTGRSGGWCRLC